MSDAKQGLSKGFTLTEVIVTIVILGALAGLAIPSYNNTIEQSRANEAQVNLNTIYMAEKIFRANNGSYWGPAANPVAVATINTGLRIDLAAPQFYTTINITPLNGGAQTFTATATRVGGGWNGRVASINQTGTYTAP